jgi:hypothetical protein
MKKRELICELVRGEFEIREVTEPANNRGVVIPGCDWPTRD